MKRVKRSPYGKVKVEIVPVTVDGSDTVYFAKMPITPDTDPVDVQTLQRRQAKVSALISVASNRLAQERKISPDDARSLFFSTPAEGVEASSVNFMDYLSSEEIENLLLVQSERPDFYITSATMMMQRRLAFDVTVTGSSESSHTLKDSWFDLVKGDRIQFGDQIIEVAKTGSTVEFSAPIPAGSIGFLVKPDGDYLLGDPNWSEAQTRSFLSLDQIAAIHQVYEASASGATEEEGKQIPPLEDQPSPSIDTSTQIQSTGGETSTQNAVTSVFHRPTIASDTTNSETPQPA